MATGQSNHDGPLDLFVLSPLASADRATDLTRRPQRVDKDTLAEHLRQTAPSLEGAALCFNDFRDFRPERLATILPVARELIELRGLLERVEKRQTEPEAIREALARIPGPPELVEAIRIALSPPSSVKDEPPPRTQPPPEIRPAKETTSGSGSPQSIFDMVDLDGSRRGEAAGRPDESGAATEAPTHAKRLLQGLLDDLLDFSRSGEGPTPAMVRPLCEQIDRALAPTLRATIHEETFQRLESAWLGLRFLVRRLDFRSGLRLFALGSTRNRLIQDLREKVIPEVRAQRSEGRVVCLLLDFSFGFRPEDLTDLSEIVRLASEERVPTVAGFEPSALGVSRLREIRALDNLPELLDGPAFAGWSDLRSREESVSVALVANRFLLRSPYGRHGDRVKGFAFEEHPGDASDVAAHDWCPWGNPIWILGTLIGSSFARTGWGVDIAFGGEGSIAEDLPIQDAELHTGETVQIPLEALLPENRVLEFSQIGIVTLACRRNSDQAFVITAPTLHRVARGHDAPVDREASRRATLPYQLFVAQITSSLESIWGSIDPRCSVEEITKTLAAGLEFLGVTRSGPVYAVTGEVVETVAGAQRIRLLIDPKGGPLRGLPGLALELPAPGSSSGL